MRIVAGEFKGRRLAAPAGRATRPTSDRLREALFSMLEARAAPALEGARVIDLFAGSGALGFEAISRGAAFALMVEIDATARGAIRENQDALGLFGKVRIHRRDAARLGAKPAGLGPPFNLAFLDPPYREGLVAPALEALKSGAWLSAHALCVVETAHDEPLDAPHGFEPEAERAQGEGRVHLVRFAGA